MLLTSGIILGMEAVTYLLWKSISDNFKGEYLKIFSGQLSPLPGVISFTLYLISSLVICYFCQTSALAILGTELTLSLVIFMYSMHAYICVEYICSSISICVHVYVCVCVYRHEMTSSVILDNSSLCWLRSPPQLNSELINLASLACQLALESSRLLSLCGTTDESECQPGYYVRSGDLSSGAHICAKNLLITQPSPQPLNALLLWLEISVSFLLQCCDNNGLGGVERSWLDERRWGEPLWKQWCLRRSDQSRVVIWHQPGFWAWGESSCF